MVDKIVNGNILHLHSFVDNGCWISRLGGALRKAASAPEKPHENQAGNLLLRVQLTTVTRLSCVWRQEVGVVSARFLFPLLLLTLPVGSVPWHSYATAKGRRELRLPGEPTQLACSADQGDRAARRDWPCSVEWRSPPSLPKAYAGG